MIIPLITKFPQDIKKELDEAPAVAADQRLASMPDDKLKLLFKIVKAGF